MAKIGNLQVTKIKIIDGSLNSFYHAANTGGSALSLTVTTVSNNPTLIFAFCWSNSVQVRRTRGDKFIGSGEGVPPDGYTAFVCFDDDPADGDVYKMTGQLSGSPANELGALVKLK